MLGHRLALTCKFDLNFWRHCQPLTAHTAEVTNPMATHAFWFFCRTNFDCDNLESFLTGLGGGGKFRGKMEKGVENPYSCLVLAGARSMDERRQALQVATQFSTLCSGHASVLSEYLEFSPD